MKSPLGAKGHEGAFAGALPERGKGAFPIYRNVPYTAPSDTEKGHGGIKVVSPPAQPDPLEAPGVRRLLLSEAASRYLEATGEDAFQIISKASYPATPGRWVIYLRPVPMAVAAAACDVLSGKARAVRIKPVKVAKSNTLSA